MAAAPAYRLARSGGSNSSEETSRAYRSGLGPRPSPSTPSWTPTPCPDGRIASRRSTGSGTSTGCHCSFETVVGPLTLERAFYHSQPCGEGICPRDPALGLLGTSLSPAVTRMTGLAAALTSFRSSSELLAQPGAVTVRAKREERAAEALGREIAVPRARPCRLRTPCHTHHMLRHRRN